MYKDEETPDRRFWTHYDHLKFEQEARALRRAEIYAMTGRLVERMRRSTFWQRVRSALANAGMRRPKSGSAHDTRLSGT